jgi:hypothetical protein
MDSENIRLPPIEKLFKVLRSGELNHAVKIWRSWGTTKVRRGGSVVPTLLMVLYSGFEKHYRPIQASLEFTGSTIIFRVLCFFYPAEE